MAAHVRRSSKKQYADVEVSHLYVDAGRWKMVRAPERFDVLVTSNMFGDILTDLGAAIVGGLGLAASGNIHPGRCSLFEPVHGSAPDIAGKGVANPLGAISSMAMLLEHIGEAGAAARVQAAVALAVTEGAVTRDLGGALSTSACGDSGGRCRRKSRLTSRGRSTSGGPPPKRAEPEPVREPDRAPPIPPAVATPEPKREEPRVFTVSDSVRGVARTVEGRFGMVSVEGEILELLGAAIGAPVLHAQGRARRSCRR